jgi:hypothetical protein
MSEPTKEDLESITISVVAEEVDGITTHWEIRHIKILLGLISKVRSDTERKTAEECVRIACPNCNRGELVCTDRDGDWIHPYEDFKFPWKYARCYADAIRERFLK